MLRMSRVEGREEQRRAFRLHGKGAGRENLERRADAGREGEHEFSLGSVTVEIFAVVQSCITNHVKTQCLKRQRLL